jgi:hypothetical protein
MTASRTDYCDPTLLKLSDSSRWTVKNALQEHGFIVDHRAVRVGESLDDYDLVIVDANDPRGSKTQHHLGALWALVQDWTDGPPVCINWDHWDIKRIFRGMLNEIDPIGTPSGPRKWVSEAKMYAEVLEMQGERWGEGYWQQGLCCAFRWGDHERILSKTNLDSLFLFDPSQDQPTLAEESHQKRRVWVLAALTNHQKWVDSLGLKWPVEYYGAVSGQRIDRDDLLHLYSESWGILSPPYYHAGSGYWRARIVHSAKAGCVLGCGDKEVPYWAYGDDLRAYESFDDATLRHVAEKQQEWFWKNTTSREETIERLGNKFFEMAKRKRGGDPLPSFGQDTLL